MSSKVYLSFFISSLSFLTFGVMEEVKAITKNNVNQTVTKCSYDAAQYKSLTNRDKIKYCINKNNRVIEYVYASGNIYKNDMGALDIEEFQDNDEVKFLQKWSIENDELVSYRCKMEGLSACEFNRLAIGMKIFFGYKGEKFNDKPNGKGTYIWKNGDEYVGDWVNGQRTGQGTFIWSNGRKYVGDWVDDKRNGKGTLTWTVGDKYEGDWVDGKLNGKGTYFWKNGDEYVGDWVDDKRNGKGILTFVRGDKYEGDWVDGNFDGYGKYTFPNGTIEEGKWSNNKFIGSSNSNPGSPNSNNVE